MKPLISFGLLLGLLAGNSAGPFGLTVRGASPGLSSPLGSPETGPLYVLVGFVVDGSSGGLGLPFTPFSPSPDFPSSPSPPEPDPAYPGVSELPLQEFPPLFMIILGPPMAPPDIPDPPSPGEGG